MSNRQHRLNTLMFFGVLLVGLAALVAALAPRFSPTYTPKDAIVEHGYRETYLEPNVQEDSKAVVDGLKRCNASGQLACNVEVNAVGDLEVIGTPSTTQAPAPQAAPAPPKADLTVRPPSERRTSTTVPSYSDRVVIPPLDDANMFDCTAHGDPFQPACQESMP